MAKRETYPEARERLFRELRALDYQVKDKLKVPQVRLTLTVPKMEYVDTITRTLYFLRQAVYLDDLSMGIDIRGMSADTLLAIVTETHIKRLEIGR